MQDAAGRSHHQRWATGSNLGDLLSFCSSSDPTTSWKKKTTGPTPHTHTRDMGAQIPPLPPSPLLLESVVQETPFGHTTLLLLQRRRERVMWCPFWRATANPDARPQRASAPPPPAGRGYICTCPRSHFLCFVFDKILLSKTREKEKTTHTQNNKKN